MWVASALRVLCVPLVGECGCFGAGFEKELSIGYTELNTGVFALVIDPSFFRPLTEYRPAVDYLLTMVKHALPAQGKQGALIPGEPEMACKAVREKEGISIDDNTMAELKAIAASLGVSID